MAEKFTIESLNDDELLQIFVNLDQFTLKEAFETCNRFNRIITENEEFIAKRIKPYKQIKVSDFIQCPIKYKNERSFLYDTYNLQHYDPNNHMLLERKLIKYIDTFKFMEMSEFYSKSIEFVVSRMKVKRLSLNMDNPHQNFYSFNFEINNTICELHLKVDAYFEISNCHNLFKNCKAVKKLKFTTLSYQNPRNRTICSLETIKIIASNMPNLKHLTIFKLPFNFQHFHPIFFNNLEFLSVDEVDSEYEHRSWISFSTGWPNLKEIEINQIESNDNITIPSDCLNELLRNCKNLEKLIIGPSFGFTDEFVQTILNSESKNFGYLEIKSKRFDEDLERAEIFNDSRVNCKIVQFKSEPKNDPVNRNPGYNTYREFYCGIR